MHLALARQCAGKVAGTIPADDGEDLWTLLWHTALLKRVRSPARAGRHSIKRSSRASCAQSSAVAKRLGLLHELVPKAIRVVVLVNPANVPAAELALRDVQEAARTIGLQTQVLNASTSSEIDAAFAILQRERPDALFVAPDGFFSSRRVQIATLAARDRIPAAYASRAVAAAGGLMSYGTPSPNREVGVYVGKILNGAKPADLPEPTKFEFVINLKTAKALGLTIPETLLATADEVIQ
jgi:putative ABC transport system substrate-binding protein